MAEGLYILGIGQLAAVWCNFYISTYLMMMVIGIANIISAIGCELFFENPPFQNLNTDQLGYNLLKIKFLLPIFSGLFFYFYGFTVVPEVDRKSTNQII